MVAVFLGLLAFHSWLLYRMVNQGNWLLAGLLLVAIGLFLWRIVHYAALYRAHTAGEARRDAATERRQIRTMIPVLVGLLALHASLIWVTLATNPLTVVEYIFAALLVGAVFTFVVRLVYYGRRLAALRKER